MKPETIGEINIMFQNLLTEVGKLRDAVKENTFITEKVLTQATLTNGRMNTVEPLAFDYRDKVAQAKGAVLVITLIGISAIAVGGFAVNSYINYKTEQIKEGVVTQLETNYNIRHTKK